MLFVHQPVNKHIAWLWVGVDVCVGVWELWVCLCSMCTGYGLQCTNIFIGVKFIGNFPKGIIICYLLLFLPLLFIFSLRVFDCVLYFKLQYLLFLFCGSDMRCTDRQWTVCEWRRICEMGAVLCAGYATIDWTSTQQQRIHRTCIILL